MRAIKILMLVTIVVITASCGSANAEQPPVPIEFETYNNSVKESEGSGFPLSLDICIDSPVGDGELQQNVKKGIMELLSQSAISKALGAPQGSTVKEFGDNYAATFKQKAKAGLGRSVVIRVSHVYQNEKCVVLYVDDDGVDFESSRKYEVVIRLSDGHLMTNDEIAKISKAQLLDLARKYADESQQKGGIEEEGKYDLSIGDGELLFHPDQHQPTEYAIPMQAVESFLTEDGKAMMAAKPLMAERPIGPEDIVKGDLGLYYLRGPVKSAKDFGSETEYTFDTSGYLQTYNGMSVKLVLYEKITRNDKGLPIECYTASDSKNTFTYNNNGLPVKRVYTVGNRVEQIDTYYYNSQDELIKVNGMLILNENDNTGITEKYYGFKYDLHGNWIERNGSKREITYYE